MSPSKEEIALYCAQNSTVYILPSNLDDFRRFDKS